MLTRQKAIDNATRVCNKIQTACVVIDLGVNVPLYRRYGCTGCSRIMREGGKIVYANTPAIALYCRNGETWGKAKWIGRD